MKSKVSLWNISLLLVSIIMLQPAAFSQTKTFRYNTSVNSNIKGLYESLPRDYNTQSGSFPLLIYINGTGCLGDGSKGQLEKVTGNLWGSPADRTFRSPDYFHFPPFFTVKGHQFEYIIITPQFAVEPWSRYTTDINDLIDYCIAHYKVDQNRIYLAGQSAGGNYVLNYIGSSLENANRVTGVLLSAAAGELSQSQANIVSQAQIALWFCAANMDKQFGDGGARRYAENTVNRLKNASPKPVIQPRITILMEPDKDHASAGIWLYNENNRQDGLSSYEWLLQYSRQTVLPVTELKLSAKVNNQSVSLEWSARSEINSASYTIERSGNAKDFSELSTIVSADAANGSSYSFVDNNPLTGTNYYRIKHLDKDGTATYSNVVSVSSNAASELKIYPNPVRNMLTLEINQSPGKISAIRIYDNAGKLYKEFSAGGNGREQLDVSSFPKGFYAGKIIGDNKVINFSFIKN